MYLSEVTETSIMLHIRSNALYIKTLRANESCIETCCYNKQHRKVIIGMPNILYPELHYRPIVPLTTA